MCLPSAYTEILSQSSNDSASAVNLECVEKIDVRVILEIALRILYTIA